MNRARTRPRRPAGPSATWTVTALATLLLCASVVPATAQRGERRELRIQTGFFTLVPDDVLVLRVMETDAGATPARVRVVFKPEGGSALVFQGTVGPDRPFALQLPYEDTQPTDLFSTVTATIQIAPAGDGDLTAGQPLVGISVLHPPTLAVKQKWECAPPGGSRGTAFFCDPGIVSGGGLTAAPSSSDG